MESLTLDEFYKVFSKIHDTYSFPIGIDNNNNYVFFDLAKTSNLFIAGKSGSGRCPFHHFLLTTLLHNNSPRELQVLLIDPYVVEFQPYKNCPQIMGFVTDYNEMQYSLEHVLYEMEKRKILFKKHQVHNLDEYNKKTKKTLPRFLVIMNSPRYPDYIKNYVQYINKLTCLSKDVGINIIISTYNILPEVQEEELQAYQSNFSNVICFTEYSLEDSIRILGKPGAEELDLYKDCLYKQDNQITKLKRFSYLGTEDIETLILKINK